MGFYWQSIPKMVERWRIQPLVAPAHLAVLVSRSYRVVILPHVFGPSAAVWSAVHNERQALIGELEFLTPEQWAQPSLCPGWDIHDVVARLVDSAKTTRLSFLRRLIAARFDFDKDNANGVTRERAATPEATPG